jgi:DNA repair protein RecN (Recombination protein N)
MLTALNISQVVLIDKLQIEFQPGFCALTGETGAGKSILLDSLGLALGARADAGLVRKGAEQATVSATFSLDKKHPVHQFLQAQELESDATLILRRVLSADGRSRAFINDQPVSVSLLRQVGDILVEIHGQFDTQGLLDPDTHRVLLDSYAAVDADGLAGLWDAWRADERALAVARADMEKARSEENYLRQSVEDLSALAPEEGEEEKLVALRDRLSRRTQIAGNLATADNALVEAESAMNVAYRALERVGDSAAEAVKALDRTQAEMKEAFAAIHGLSADLEDSDHDLESIDDRLHDLRAQARKHGVLVADLPATLEKLTRQLALIDGQDRAIDDLVAAAERARRAFVKMAGDIGKQRRAAAEKLDGLVAKELPPLKLDKARFVTAIDDMPEDQWGPGGMDRVRFLVATNPGAEPGALNKIASGGEMARFMLALKVVMAAVGTAGSLVFDEVDSGIGGATAAAVGERLARLATKRQILVVTHSPQVAARAKHHWIVLKDGKKDVTTKIIPLGELAERKEEIARMISGAAVTDEARAAAKKLLETGT